MPDYHRLRSPGGTYFFTVNLLDRRSDLLMRHIDALRAAVYVTRAARPFRIDAWVVLPDHLHCLWTLPPGDDDYSNRWKAIKIRFVQHLPAREPRSDTRARRASAASGNGVSGNTSSVTRRTMHTMQITSISIPSNIAGRGRCRNGRIPRSIAGSRRVSIHRTGRMTGQWTISRPENRRAEAEGVPPDDLMKNKHLAGMSW